jgi:hypothetical protein
MALNNKKHFASISALPTVSNTPTKRRWKQRPYLEKRMKVQGVEIPQQVQDDAVCFMKGSAVFRSQDVQRVIDQHPMIDSLAWKPAGLSMRVADRIIQRERKAGVIGPDEMDRPRAAAWRWLRRER